MKVQEKLSELLIMNTKQMYLPIRDMSPIP